MRRFTLVAVLGMAVLVAGCTKTLDMPKAQAAISEGLTQQLGVTVAKVTCPESREMKAADAFECTADIDGGAKLTVQVTQKDGEGNIDWKVSKTEGMIDLVAVETSVVNGLKEQAGVGATVTCGGKYRSAQPGKTFECRAKIGEDQTTIIVTMKDLEGNISWETAPPK